MKVTTLSRDAHSAASEIRPTAGRETALSGVMLRIAWRRKWQIVLPAIAIAAAASWWVHRLPDRYRADTLLLFVPQRVPETFVRSTVTTRGDDRLQWTTQQILSRSPLEQIVRDFDLYAAERRTAAVQDVVDAMRARDIEIKSVKGDAFRLSFIADSPQVAARVVDRLVSLFIGQATLDRARLAEGTDQFLESQLEDARRKLVDNEAKLEEYRRHHAGGLPTQLDANVQGLHNTEMQMQVLADALNRDRDRQLVLERSLKEATLAELTEPGAATRARVASGDPVKLTAAEQLDRAEAALAELRLTLTEQHPDIITLKQTTAELRTRAKADEERRGEQPVPVADALRRTRLEELRADLSVVERQIAEKAGEGERLRAVLQTYQKRIENAPTREAELAGLTRDYDTLQQTYRGLLTKKQESEMAANLERQQIGAQFKVLDPTRLPEHPFAPDRPRLYAIAVLSAIGVGLLLAAFLEWLDRGMRTEDDVRVALGLPVLAAIPNVPARRFWK